MSNLTRVGLYLDPEAFEIYNALQEEDGFNFSFEIRKWLKSRNHNQKQPELSSS